MKHFIQGFNYGHCWEENKIYYKKDMNDFYKGSICQLIQKNILHIQAIVLNSRTIEKKLVSEFHTGI
jgi:hypothetical protein